MSEHHQSFHDHFLHQNNDSTSAATSASRAFFNEVSDLVHAAAALPMSQRDAVAPAARAEMLPGSALYVPPIGADAAKVTDKAHAPNPIPERDQKLIDTMRARGAADGDVKTFTEDLKKLRERGLGDRQVDMLLDQVERLMDSKGERPVTQEERRHVAMQIVHHSARPNEIDQGYHNTCNVTTLQERLFTRCPVKAAEMIVTACVTGEWVAPDGKHIKLDGTSFVPGREERQTYPHDGERSQASMIFQLVAVNDAVQRRHPAQFYRQDTHNRSGDTGERLYYEGNEPVMETKDGKKRQVASPTLSDNEIGQIGCRLTNEKGYILANATRADGECVTPISSTDQLVKMIEDLKKRGQLPATIVVDANYPGLGGSSNPKTPGQWHVVTITGYDSKTHKFKVSNQWGSKYDREINANDMFNAMHEWPEK